MYARILRLIVIVWLIASPLNVTLADVPQATGVTAAPIELLNSIELHPPFRPLTAGSPQTITLEITPSSLIANSGATALITATVYDLTGELVSGVNLTGLTLPATRGAISALSVTDINGQSTGTWTAGTAIGSGTIEVGNGVVSGTADIELTTGALTTIAIAPSSTTITVGLTTTFTASGADAFGNAVAITPIWTTNGGSISSSGVFTAQTSLAAGRLVTATQGSISKTASVNLVAAALQSIVVSPANANVVAGSTQPFTASGFDQYGNGVPITPTWTTNGGSIDPSGLLSVGTAVATGRLITATQNSVAGVAAVNIIAGPLASIAVSPPSTSVVVNTPHSFTASGFDDYGNAVPITPTWTTNGGSIDASGVFTAQTAIATGRFVTATQSSISGVATVNIVAGTLQTITVSPSSANVIAGATQSFTASGFDLYGNAVPVTPTWTTNGGSISASGVFTAQTTVTAGRLVTATQGAILDTASVNIVVGPLASIVVSPNSVAVAAGATQSFTAAGFDQFGNAVPITPTWTSNGGSINSSGLFVAQTMATAGRLVTATENTISGTAAVDIIAGPLTSIVVSPPSANVTAGTPRLFTASGFDQYGNSVMITPTWTTDGGSISSSGVYTAQTSVASGRLVTATQSSISGTASVNIIAGSLSSIVVSPASVNVAAGNTQSFTANGFDQYGNAVVFTPTWTTNGGSISSSGVFTAQTSVAASRLVTATHNSISGVATVNIVAAPLSSIAVSPSSASVVAATTQSFTASGFDQYGNAVPITPTWTTNGGSISASGVFTAQTAAVSGRLVTATQSSISGVATVNIIAGPLTSIAVSPPNANVAAGASQSFTASGFDQFGNAVPITPTWTTNGGSINSSGLFVAQITVAAGRLVTATQISISGIATVNVIAGPLSSVLVLPSSANVTAGTSRSFTASGFDQYGNSVPITPTWTTNGGSISSSGVYTAQTSVASGRLVTATQSSISGTASVNIIAGSLSSIVVSPASVNVAAGNTQSFTANGFDQYGNAVAITPTWTTNGGSISSSGVFTAQTSVAASRLVTATQNPISGTATVNIVAAPLNHIIVSPNAVTLTVAATQIFSASGFDQYGNAVAITPTWTTNGGSISASGVYTAQTIVAAGKRVTATQGITTGFALVNLLPGAPYTLTVQPPTAVISAGQRITYTAIATDTFGNALGTVTGGTAFSIASGSGGNFVANVVTPTVSNTWIVTGVNGSAVNTVTLTVTPATFNRLAIENAPAGSGTAVNATTLTVYDTLTVYAAAYDVYSNLIGAPIVTWGSTGVVAGNLAPTTGISTTFTPVVSGTGIITATSSGITSTTGLITVQAPLLRISKTASPEPLTPGSPLQYTIIYTNVGNAAAQNVVITETYPPSATFFSAVPAPTTGSNIWSIGALAIHDPHSIVVFMTTNSQMPVGSVLTNSVRISAAKVASAVYTTTTSVNALPNLSASINDLPDPARPGDTLSYSIQYRNDGSAPVSNVRITETYPAQVTFISASPPPDVGNNVWLTDTLNGNGDNHTILITVRVNSPLPDSTILTDRAIVSAQETSPFTTTQQTLIVAPRVELDMTAAPPAPAANSLLTYTLLYTNSGSSYAANTIITDALPVNASFAQCAPIGCSANGNVVTWNLGQLSQQTSSSVTLTVLVANNLLNGTVITNTAFITSTDQVSDTALLTSTVSSAPDVALSKSDGLTALAANQTATYALSFSNVGTAPAANVVITDRIPNNMIFVGCSSCVAIGGGVYSFTLGTLNAAQSGAVTISARLPVTLPAGLRAITNTAAIATVTSGDALTNNTAQDVDDISTRPVLGLAVDYDSTTPYPGKTITYTLHYTNTSAMDTIGVMITTTQPPWLAKPSHGWTLNNTTAVYPIGNLAAGQSGIVTYVMTLPLTYTQDMTAFVMTFVIQDGGPGGLPVAQTATTTVIGVPDLSIARVIVPPAVLPGHPFTATLIISNSGQGRACNPSNCGGFYVDAFIDPATPPPSYPYLADGDPYASVPPVAANGTVTVVMSNLQFTWAQRLILYFKIDNFNCSPSDHTDPCLPSHSLGGLVPEYNETNNVSGPIVLTTRKVYLPVAMRK